jgi:hypothetical protein
MIYTLRISENIMAQSLSQKNRDFEEIDLAGYRSDIQQSPQMSTQEFSETLRIQYLNPRPAKVGSDPGVRWADTRKTAVKDAPAPACRSKILDGGIIPPRAP